MITRPGRAPHVCLRCQRSLAKRSIAASRVAFQSTGSQAQTTNDYDTRKDQHDTDDPVTYDNSEPPRLHGHRGLKKQEFRKALTRNSLGDTAKVIVLRDSLVNWYELDPQHVEPQEAAHIDILGQLAEESGLAGWKEVEKNIDGFRPASKRQTWDEFNDLVRALQEGFTSGQLQTYIESFKEKQKPEEPKSEWTTLAPDAGLRRVTPWMPGVSELQETFDNDPLRGYFLESHTAKQRLVLQLLRECWLLELPELLDGIGQFEVEVSSGDLELLLLGNPSALHNTHSALLQGEGEKLEAFRSRNVIRVSCTHIKKPFVVQDLKDSLKRSRSTILNLVNLMPGPGSEPLAPKKPRPTSVKRWCQKHFDAATLQYLSRLTDTKMVQNSIGVFTISCLDRKQNPVMSNIDIARRLLLTSVKDLGRTKHRLVYDTTSTKEGRFIEAVVPSVLPWRERLRAWSRWTTPSRKVKQLPIRTPVTGIFIKKPGNGRTATAEAEAGASTNDLTTTASRSCWIPQYHTETSAVLGKILHSSLYSPDTPPVPLALKGYNQIQTFATEIPNLSRLLSEAEIKTPRAGGRVKSLVLRFLPNPFYPISSKVKYKKKDLTKHTSIGPNALIAFPAIEMSFAIDDLAGHPTLESISAIVHESNTDVMLPHNNVDLRFLQRTISQLRLDSVHRRQYIDPILKYVETWSVSPKNSQHFEIPPVVTLPIAKHLTRGPGFDLLRGADLESPGDQDIDEVRMVPYLFAGLESRKSMAFTYKNWRLCYTSIEAGKAGARRSELKLRSVRNGKAVEETQFVDMAYQLAHYIGQQVEGIDGVKVQARHVHEKPLPEAYRWTWGGSTESR